MQIFGSGQEAKEYLIARIVAEAKRAGIPLSETERKMMYYSETAWTIPDMAEVNDRFERECDQASYEKKVGTLARSARAHAESVSELGTWKDAVRALEDEDHYLSVLISVPSASSKSLLVDRLKLIGTALMICFLILVGIVLFSSKN